MFIRSSSARKLSLGVLLACVVLLLPRLALAHAHLVTSSPAAGATVHAGNVAIELQFNSRVDGQRSTLSLVMPDSSTHPLTLDRQGSPSYLNAHATLHPGAYTIRWQALATDGHITRGEIPFTVK